MKDLKQHAVSLADRLDGLELSEIVQISERAAQLRGQGVDVITLSTGEPDFPTPDFVIEAAFDAARKGQMRYTATKGTPELRAAIAQDHGREIDEVIVSTGAKQVLSNALLATINPGDEVIMPAPFWTSYADMVRMVGGGAVVVACPMSQNFKLPAQQLADSITPKTKWLMLNSPSNPSGAIYTAKEISELAEVLRKNPHVGVISDEIYAHLSFERFTSFTAAAPDLADRTLIVSGVSKAWAMTGWRIGWGVGPSWLIKAMTAVQGQSTSGASSVSQAAALAALTGDRALLNTKAVAVVPGRAFGLPGHFRLSFAYSEADLTDGLGRIREFLEDNAQ